MIGTTLQEVLLGVGAREGVDDQRHGSRSLASGECRTMTPPAPSISSVAVVLLDEDRRKSLQGTWCRGQFRGRGPEFSLTPGHRGKWVRLPPLTKPQVSHPGSQQGGVRSKTPVPTGRGLLVGGDTMPKLGKTNDRGYGRQHQLLREAYKQRMARGEQFTCWRCGGWVDPAQPWDLGHDDHDRSVYRGPEHRGVECSEGGNRATAGRRGADVTLRRWSL